MKKGFSLVELIIAISLMGLIILAIVAVDVGSRGFLRTSDDESTLQNEANFIMETIVKDLGKSFKGTKNNPSVKVPSNDMLEIRNRGASGSFELSNSKWVRYQFDSAAKTIK
jgi:prepilin-type N-terminal cleavage/methylation domain-containing protein